MPYVTNEGVSIHYEVSGEGLPVVLHTGGAGDLNMWREAGYVAGLADFQCILLDHRGRGLSDRPKGLEAHRPERYVSDVVAVLDALNVPRAAFWGYSFGRCVGFELARRHPERVSGLILSGGMEASDQAEYQIERRQSMEMARRLRQQGMAALLADIESSEFFVAFPEWLRQNFLETDAEQFALSLEAWESWAGPWPILPEIRQPVLMLLGEAEDDGNVGRAFVTLPDARYVVFPGLGHVGAFLRGDMALPHAREVLRGLK